MHFDPRRQLSDRPGQLKRQRMDFLLLLPRRARVVLEIDGAEHYSANGVASPARYAEMVSEDRALRLARYEVYRFGGHELATKGPAMTAILDVFFDLARCSDVCQAGSLQLSKNSGRSIDSCSAPYAWSNHCQWLSGSRSVCGADYLDHMA